MFFTAIVIVTMMKGVCVLLDANFEQGGETLAIQLSNVPPALILRRLLRVKSALAIGAADDGCWRPWKLQMANTQWMNRFFSEPTLGRGEQVLLGALRCCRCHCCCHCCRGLESRPLSLQELSPQDCLTHPCGSCARGLNVEADSAVVNWMSTWGHWLNVRAACRCGSCAPIRLFSRKQPHFPLNVASSPLRLDNAPLAPD